MSSVASRVCSICYHFLLTLLRSNESVYHKNFSSTHLRIYSVHQRCDASFQRWRREVERKAKSIWFSNTLWAEPAADQHTWIHFIWSLLRSYGAKRSCQFPASCHLPVSDTDEKCSMFRSPQHYHSVFSICWDQMTPKCWSSKINVVLCNTWFTLTFLCVVCIWFHKSL